MEKMFVVKRVKIGNQHTGFFKEIKNYSNNDVTTSYRLDIIPSFVRFSEMRGW